MRLNLKIRQINNFHQQLLPIDHSLSLDIIQNIEHHFHLSTLVSMVVKFFFYEQFTNQLQRTTHGF